MRDPRRCPRTARTPAPADGLLEALEPRLHLSVFAYTSLTQYLAESSPLFTLRPAGEDAPAPTIASSVAGAGDIDGDGVNDILVGSGGRSSQGGGGPIRAVAAVYSGATGRPLLTVADGSALLTFTGARPNANLGAAVAFAGDVDFDGRDDLLVGSPAANPDAAVLVYSGDGGGLLHAFTARAGNLVGSDRLGTAVAALGDITGDGIIDFVFAGTQDANAGRNDRSRMYVFSGAPAANLQPRGINDDPAIWGSAGSGGADFLILNGERFILHAREGFLPGDRVIDVSNSDVVLGAAADGGAFLWEAGVRTALEDIIVAFDGPEGDYASLRAVDITDEGLVLVERLRSGETPTAWVLDGGTLRYLFDGTPVRLNASGAAVGLAPDAEDVSVFWTAAGGAVLIEGFRAVDLNDGDAAVGTGPIDSPQGQREALIWKGGELRPMIPALAPHYIPTAINNDGHIVGIYERPGGGRDGFFFAEGIGFYLVSDAVIDPPPALTTSSRIILADVNNIGLIVGSAPDTGAGFILTLAADAIAGTRDGPIDAQIPADGAQSVVTLNPAGDIIVYRRDPATGAWSAINLTQAAGAPRADEVASFTLHDGGQVFYVAVAPDGLYLINERADTDGNPTGRGWSVRNLTAELEGAAPIVRGLNIMTAGGLTVIAGLDEAGDVVAYRSAGVEVIPPEREVRPVFSYENLSETHLRPGSFATPAFVGRLVSFVTSWNAMHLAGLDEDGRIWAVWTAPELGGRWQSVNLSEVTGAPTIVGALTPFLTPWGTIHIAGADESGDTVVAWWAPGFGGRWEKNNLTREFNFAKLRPQSVSSFVTPWGGLNIAGLDDRGEVRVYWWSPESNTWRIDGIDAARPDRAARPLRRLDGFAGRDSTMNLFGVGPGGDLLRLHWAPGQVWQFENLTQAARA